MSPDAIMYMAIIVTALLMLAFAAGYWMGKVQP